MKIRKRRSDRSGRAPLSSPGRPSVAGRDERRRFWAAIAVGLENEDAALEAGVPPVVGTRWFRKAGGYYPRCLDNRPSRSRAGISCSRSGRKSRFFARGATQCGKSLAGSGLPVDFPDDDTMRISHEAIYQALFVRGRGALRRELTACLRTGRPLRTPRCASTSPKAPISACAAPRRLPPRPSPPRCARAKRDFRAAALNVGPRLDPPRTSRGQDAFVPG
jgi:hypothetical protein